MCAECVVQVVEERGVLEVLGIVEGLEVPAAIAASGERGCVRVH